MKGDEGGSRKKKKCLIGDSIAGQVKVALLGKSTNTFVRRIRAQKNKGEHSEEVKDAKLILIHTGINKKYRLMHQITSRRDNYTETVCTRSKNSCIVTDTGRHRELDMDRTVLKAGSEK